MESGPTTIDAYLAPLPPDQRAALEGLRAAIRSFVPEAIESISYGVPTFKYRGRPLIYFAAAKKHLALYGTAAGTLRFQPDEPPTETVIHELLTSRKTSIDETATRPRKKKGDDGA